MGLKMPKQQPEDINWTIRFSLVAIACTIILAAVNLPYIIWRKTAKKNAPDQYWIMIMLIFNLALFDASSIISALSCGLVTGFILTHAIVDMLGLAKLTDKNFLLAFQVTDKIIQNNQPLFMLIWVGLIMSVITTYKLASNPSRTISSLIFVLNYNKTAKHLAVI